MSDTGLGDMLVLCNVSVATLPLEAVIPAAARVGFDAISVLARSHRRAVTRAGLTNADLLALLQGHGLLVTDVEAVGDWLAPTPFAEDSMFHPVYGVEQFLEVAEGLRAETLVATHFGPVAPADQASEAFAGLCDRAADRGVRVALEFPAMATVADVRSAWEIVRGAGRANGGLLVDLWHHRRSDASDDDLLQVPADRIFSVQVCDAAAEPIGLPIEDVAHRRLPGDGDLGVADFLASLDRHGVRCPVGVEVLRRELVEGGAEPAAVRLHDALVDVVTAARRSADG
jgi:sugar phosphate isomerase/epimerase